MELVTLFEQVQSVLKEVRSFHSVSNRDEASPRRCAVFLDDALSVMTTGRQFTDSTQIALFQVIGSQRVLRQFAVVVDVDVSQASAQRRHIERYERVVA